MKTLLFKPAGYCFLFLFVSVITISCKKDRDDTAKPGLAGTWRGIYETGSFQGNKFLLILRPDSTLRIFNSFDTSAATLKSEGTWHHETAGFFSSYDLGTNNKFVYGTINAQLDYIEGYFGASASIAGRAFLFRQ